jgi:hypothetical protein
MAVTITTVKFKGLTNFTGDSNYLKYSNGSNELQTSATPYEATYKVDFLNHSVISYFYPTTATIGGVTPPDATYAGKYKINFVWSSLNHTLKFGYFDPSGSNLLNVMDISSNANTFNIKKDNFQNMNYSFKSGIDMFIENGTIDWTSQQYFSLEEISYFFDIPTGKTLTGSLIFSIKYYDKYLINPA